jgi:hypothetical protein
LRFLSPNLPVYLTQPPDFFNDFSSTYFHLMYAPFFMGMFPFSRRFW